MNELLKRFVILYKLLFEQYFSTFTMNGHILTVEVPKLLHKNLHFYVRLEKVLKLSPFKKIFWRVWRQGDWQFDQIMVTDRLWCLFSLSWVSFTSQMKFYSK